MKSRDSDTPIRFFPLMEMARKYEVEDIQKLILERVEMDWPKTLEEWDQIDEPFQIRKGEDPTGASSNQKTNLPEPIAAINFAKRFELYDILPAAFLELLRTPYGNDWDKLYPQNKKAPAGKSRIKGARWHLLTKEDHILLGKLREIIRQQPEKRLDKDGHCTDRHDRKELHECREYLQFRLRAADDVLRVSQACCNSKLSGWHTRFKLCLSCLGCTHLILSLLRSHLWTVVEECSE